MEFDTYNVKCRLSNDRCGCTIKSNDKSIPWKCDHHFWSWRRCLRYFITSNDWIQCWMFQKSGCYYQETNNFETNYRMCVMAKFSSTGYQISLRKTVGPPTVSTKSAPNPNPKNLKILADFSRSGTSDLRPTARTVKMKQNEKHREFITLPFSTIQSSACYKPTPQKMLQGTCVSLHDANIVLLHTI